MVFIGITGPIGHGKSTFADAIADVEPSTLHLESGAIISEVVDALHRCSPIPTATDGLVPINVWLSNLPSIVKHTVHVHCSVAQIVIHPHDLENDPLEYQKLFEHLALVQKNPGLAKQAISAENKSTYRPILQWIGGYLVRKIDPNIWYNEIVRRAQEAGQQGVKVVVAGGVRYPIEADTIRMAGGKVIRIYRPGQGEQDASDPTERERQNIQADVTVVNNGTLEELADVAKTVVTDALASSLKAEYHARYTA